MDTQFKLVDLRNEGLNFFFSILDIFDEHNFMYWLDYGTFLGAYRDKKIIPWDGEFDISAWDHEIDQDDLMWNRVTSAGCTVDFGHDNIKIKKQDVRIGSFIIDLHRYKQDNGYATYKYGRLPVTLHGKFASLLSFIVSSAIKLKSIDDINFETLYKHITSSEFAQKDGIESQEYEIILGKYPTNPFAVRNNDGVLSHFTPYSGKNKLLMLFIKLIQFLPERLKERMKGAVNQGVRRHKKIPARVIRIPEEYFTGFSTVTFSGRSCPCTQFPQEYLKMIYGENWRVPRRSWDISKDSPTFKNSKS